MIFNVAGQSNIGSSTAGSQIVFRIQTLYSILASSAARFINCREIKGDSKFFNHRTPKSNKYQLKITSNLHI